MRRESGFGGRNPRAQQALVGRGICIADWTRFEWPQTHEDAARFSGEFASSGGSAKSSGLKSSPLAQRDQSRVRPPSNRLTSAVKLESRQKWLMIMAALVWLFSQPSPKRAPLSAAVGRTPTRPPPELPAQVTTFDEPARRPRTAPSRGRAPPQFAFPFARQAGADLWARLRDSRGGRGARSRPTDRSL